MGFLKITNQNTGRVMYSNFDEVRRYSPTRKNQRGDIVEHSEESIARVSRDTTPDEDKFLREFNKAQRDQG